MKEKKKKKHDSTYGNTQNRQIQWDRNETGGFQGLGGRSDG